VSLCAIPWRGYSQGRRADAVLSAQPSYSGDGNQPPSFILYSLSLPFILFALRAGGSEIQRNGKFPDFRIFTGFSFLLITYVFCFPNWETVPLWTVLECLQLAALTYRLLDPRNIYPTRVQSSVEYKHVLHHARIRAWWSHHVCCFCIIHIWPSLHDFFSSILHSTTNS
jgi:hypothetical protein